MQGLHSSLSGDLSQAGTSAKGAGDQFHSADRFGHGLCSLQLPLSAGLSDGLCNFPRVLGELAGQGQRLMAVCSTKCSYRLVSLPKYSRSSRLKITNAMSVVSH